MPAYPELMQDLHERKLYYRDSQSDKEYWVSVAKAAADGKWLVIGSWGRRGRVAQCKLYLRTNELVAALNEANVLMGGKVDRGYRDAHGLNPDQFTVSEIDGKAVQKEPVEVPPMYVTDFAEAFFG